MHQNFNYQILIVVVACMVSVQVASAHQGHLSQESKVESVSEKDILESKYSRINKSYLESVKPIFQKKCFDCHSQSTSYPWYYKIPIAKQVIDSDVQEAKEHIDFTGDFPFHGHGSPVGDIQAIKTEVAEGEMPPFRYLIMHWQAKLSASDKKTIIEWTDQAQDILNEK